MKSEKTLKTKSTIFHYVTVSKTLGKNWIMKYSWKYISFIWNLVVPYITNTFTTQNPFTNRGQPKNENMGSCLSISLAVPDYTFVKTDLVALKLCLRCFCGAASADQTKATTIVPQSPAPVTSLIREIQTRFPDTKPPRVPLTEEMATAEKKDKRVKGVSFRVVTTFGKHFFRIPWGELIF